MIIIPRIKIFRMKIDKCWASKLLTGPEALEPHCIHCHAALLSIYAISHVSDVTLTLTHVIMLCASSFYLDLITVISCSWVLARLTLRAFKDYKTGRPSLFSLKPNKTTLLPFSKNYIGCLWKSEYATRLPSMYTNVLLVCWHPPLHCTSGVEKAFDRHLTPLAYKSQNATISRYNLLLTRPSLSQPKVLEYNPNLCTDLLISNRIQERAKNSFVFTYKIDWLLLP